MKIKNLMERTGLINEGMAVSVLEEFSIELEGLIDRKEETSSKENIVADKRFYALPTDLLSLKGVNIKNHDNTEGEYRSIPRLLTAPTTLDADET